MAMKIKPNLVYKCQTPNIGAASIHVVSSSGDIVIKGSNVTEYDPNTKKVVIPAVEDLVETGDTIASGTIALLSGTPEFICFSGDNEAVIYAKMTADQRFVPAEEDGE